GDVADYAELARLGRVSRARITQIANLLALSPRIQEELLFLPSVERGREPIHLRQLQPIARLRDWRQQGRAWRELQRRTYRGGGQPERNAYPLAVTRPKDWGVLPYYQCGRRIINVGDGC